MKYLLLFSMCLVGCAENKKEPELHYGDKVTIKKGFFKGCTGIVVALDNLGGCYKVELDAGCDYQSACLEYDMPEQWR